MTVRLAPASLAGRVAAPASKSDAHRCLIAAALADAPTVLDGLTPSEDVDATLACLRALGMRMERGVIRPLTGTVMDMALLPCGQSAATLRFLLPVAATLGVTAHFTGAGRLPSRPLAPLLDALAAHGISMDSRALPLTVSGELKGGRFTLPGDISSQFISGVLLALPLAGGGEIVLTSPLGSAGYVDMTRAVMARWGVETVAMAKGYRVPGSRRYLSPGRVTVQGDWSSAAYWLAAGALGGPVAVSGLSLDSPQPDRAIMRLLQAFGAQVWTQDGCVRAQKGSLRGITADVSGCPDLFPVLAALGAAAEGTTRLMRAGRLRLKESDRLQTTLDMVRRLGGRAEVDGDVLTVHGTHLTGGTVADTKDHRIVMAAAVAALACADATILPGAGAVRKSYPGFFEAYASLGGRCHVVDDR